VPNSISAGGTYSAPPEPLAEFKERLLREREGRIREEREREGGEGKVGGDHTSSGI